MQNFWVDQFVLFDPRENPGKEVVCTVPGRIISVNDKTAQIEVQDEFKNGKRDYSRTDQHGSTVCIPLTQIIEDDGHNLKQA